MFKRIVMLVAAVVFPIALAAQESPLEVVAHVLSLSDEQLHALGEILQARNEAIRPALADAQAHEQALAQQLESASPDPQTIGRLMIEMKTIQQQVQRVVADSNAQFEMMLTPEQRVRLEQLRSAAAVCPIIPAFRAVGLL